VSAQGSIADRQVRVNLQTFMKNRVKEWFETIDTLDACWRKTPPKI
jgi:hypothetical protein